MNIYILSCISKWYCGFLIRFPKLLLLVILKEIINPTHKQSQFKTRDILLLNSDCFARLVFRVERGLFNASNVFFIFALL